MNVNKPVCYKATCKACKTILEVTPQELNWKKANNFKCPTCSNTVFITDSLGFLNDGVQVVYKEEIHEM